jgi:hypothetical protein
MGLFLGLSVLSILFLLVDACPQKKDKIKKGGEDEMSRTVSTVK